MRTMSGDGRQLLEERAERAGWHLDHGLTLRNGSAAPVIAGKSPLAVSTGWLRQARFDCVALPGRIERALDKERAYGHLFAFSPLIMALGAAFWFSRAAGPSTQALVLLFSVLAPLAFLLRHRQTMPAYALAAAAIFVAGMLLSDYETRRAATVILDTPVTSTVEGRVVARDIDSRGRWRYVIALTATRDPQLRRPPGKVRLLSRGSGEAFTLGQTITGRARLSPPSGPALAGLNDFAFDAYFSGIGAVGYFYGNPSAIAEQGSAASSAVSRVYSDGQRWLGEVRSAIAVRIRAVIGGDAGAIAAALVTAEERAITPETVEALRQSGLAHVLAISGLNMVLAAGTFLIGARALLCLVPGLAARFPVKKIAAAGALCIVTFYILISGGAVSALRSYIMIAIMLTAVFFDRASISLRNIAIAALIIIAVTPSAVTGPGFQMSFAATLALVAGYSGWRQRPRRESRPALARAAESRLRPVAVFAGGLILSSLIGGLSTLIYSVGHFHRIPAYGLMGNLIAMPIISIAVMPMGLIAMLLMPFGLDYYPLIAMGIGIDWMIGTATVVAGWGGEITTGRIPQAAFVLIGLGGITACLLRTWLALAGGALVIAGLGIITFTPPQPQPVVIVAEDGGLVGLIAEGRLSANRQSPSDFIAGQWLRALRLHEGDPPVKRNDLALKEAGGAVKPGAERQNRARKPPIDQEAARSAMQRLLRETGPGRFACVSRQWCAARTAGGWVVITVEDPRFIAAACDIAGTGQGLVIVEARVRLKTCRSGAVLITGRSLRSSGALEIFAVDESVAPAAGRGWMRMQGAMESIARPWSVHRSYDWRTGQFVPPEGSIDGTEQGQLLERTDAAAISDSGG